MYKIKVLNKNKQTVILPEGHNKIDISGLGNNKNMIMNADLCTPSIGLATRMRARMLKYFQKHYIKNLFTSILTLGLRITEVLRCHLLSSFVVTMQTFNFIVYVKGQIYNLCNQPKRRSFFIHMEFWYCTCRVTTSTHF